MSLDVGVVGTGIMGTYHARAYRSIEAVNLQCVVDSDVGQAREVADTFDCSFSPTIREAGGLDAVSIATPTTTHEVVTRTLLNSGVDCLVEKPLAAHEKQARHLVQLADCNDCRLQVGHIERFNPAYRAFVEKNVQPDHIRAVRIAPFNQRGTDVSVIKDLMIHDLDLIMDQSEGAHLKSVQGAGYSTVTGHIDRAEIGLSFENGLTAHLTADRDANRDERTMTVQADGREFVIDFADQTLSADGRIIRCEGDALDNEIASFVKAVQKGHDPVVNGCDGLTALKGVQQIEQQIDSCDRSAVSVHAR